MTFDEYQARSRETAIYPGQGTVRGLEYVVLGLVGEVGEISQKLKRLLRDGDGWLFTERDGHLMPEFKEKMADEAMDACWYLSQLFTEVGVDFSTAAAVNLKKLASRKQRGVLGGSGDDR